MAHGSGRRRAVPIAAAAMAVATFLLFLFIRPAAAQLEVTCSLNAAGERVCPTTRQMEGDRYPLHEIFHADGRKVGEIYVVRTPGAATYVEHWVMFPGYQYPDTIRPARVQRYDGERDFLAHVPFAPGARYARWDVTEKRNIPGRR